MLSRSAVGAVMALVFTTASLSADSIATRDGVSLRGRIMSLDRRGALVSARFEEGETQVLVPREAIATIEFNALTSNAGLTLLGLPSAAPTRLRGPSTDQTDDIIVLRTGERRSCPPVEIDGQRLRCGAEAVALGDVTSLTVGRIR